MQHFSRLRSSLQRGERQLWLVLHSWTLTPAADLATALLGPLVIQVQKAEEGSVDTPGIPNHIDLSPLLAAASTSPGAEHPPSR